MLKISLNDGLSWQETDGVRILYDDLVCNRGEHDASLLVNATHEGLILDVHDDELAVNCGTSSEMAQEIVDRLTMGDKKCEPPRPIVYGICPACSCEGPLDEGCPTCPGFWYEKPETPHPLKDRFITPNGIELE